MTSSSSTHTLPMLHRLNRESMATAIFQDDTLTITTKSGVTVHELNASEIKAVSLTKLPVANRLAVLTKQRQDISINGLARSTSQDLYTELFNRVDELLNDETAKKALTIATEIAALRDSVTASLTSDRYIRRSHAEAMTQAAADLHQQLDERTRRKLATQSTESLQWLDHATDPDNLEAVRAGLNEQFLQATTPSVHEATKDILRSGLTEEQATNVAVDEDATLILAGAGTGKTAVITGKIAHLVRNQRVPPEAILALAFNRKAALEIRDRLPEDLKAAHVSTFHSFALRVVASQGTAPSISKLAQDDFVYSKALDGILARMMTDRNKAKLIIQMVSAFSKEYRAPFDFKTPLEYQQYIRDAELRTLNSELVKSFEELTVANFLAMNGIRYTYEKPYEFLTATRERRQYQPDFHLTEYDIYIEHFALNEEGQAQPGWTTYAQEAQWKREIHAQHGTALVETYSWQYRKETLESSLEQALRDRGVEFNPVPEEELVRKLSKEKLSVLSSLLGTFLNHAKSSNLEHDEILRRAKNQNDKKRTQCFLDIFKDVREGYETLLRREKALDFHDLINGAATVIKEGNWENPFTHVLIDEFQDISNGRMSLAEALKKPNLAYFLVGDDWQSIYRFAGSYVGLIHQVDDHLGFSRRESLTKTFRFGDGILAPSTGFIQQNPEQTRRSLTSHIPDLAQGIIVIPADLPETGLHQALKEIEELRDENTESIMVLGRYRSSRSILGRHSGGAKNLNFNTIHTTKGQEAEYIVVLDLKEGRYGFPCTVEDDPLLTIVMPPTHGDPFPSAEERRLFYVALTRARKAVYLITDPVRPSPFVKELIKNCPQITVRPGMRPPCPACQEGALIPSQSGDNLRCSNFPTCQHLSPRCPGCKRGYVSLNGENAAAECSNPACDSPPRLCPKCKHGVMLLRTGQSSFWGCSRYSATPSCTHTERASDQAGSTVTPGSRPPGRRRVRRARYPSRS